MSRDHSHLSTFTPVAYDLATATADRLAQARPHERPAIIEQLKSAFSNEPHERFLNKLVAAAAYLDQQSAAAGVANPQNLEALTVALKDKRLTPHEDAVAAKFLNISPSRGQATLATAERTLDKWLTAPAGIHDVPAIAWIGFLAPPHGVSPIAAYMNLSPVADDLRKQTEFHRLYDNHLISFAPLGTPAHQVAYAFIKPGHHVFQAPAGTEIPPSYFNAYGRNVPLIEFVALDLSIFGSSGKASVEYSFRDWMTGNQAARHVAAEQLFDLGEVKPSDLGYYEAATAHDIFSVNTALRFGDRDRLSRRPPGSDAIAVRMLDFQTQWQQSEREADTRVVEQYGGKVAALIAPTGEALVAYVAPATDYERALVAKKPGTTIGNYDQPRWEPEGIGHLRVTLEGTPTTYNGRPTKPQRLIDSRFIANARHVVIVGEPSAEERALGGPEWRNERWATAITDAVKELTLDLRATRDAAAPDMALQLL